MRTACAVVVAGLVTAAWLGGCGGGTPPTPPAEGSVASGYVYVLNATRATAPAEAPLRLTVVREALGGGQHRPLANAAVSLRNKDGVWLTNAQGYFEIPEVPEGQVEITVVPPADSGAGPGQFGIVAGPRHGGGVPPRPPIRPTDTLFVLPPRASLQVGEVTQFYAVALTDAGPQDLTDQVEWELRSRPGAQPVGTLTAGGVFSAERPGEGMVVAVVADETGTRQVPVFDSTVTLPAPGEALERRFAYVEVLPQFTAIRGRVLGTNDLGVRGAFVFATGLPDFALTEVNGAFFLPLVPPDTPLDLTVILNGAVLAQTTVTVPAGQVAEVTLQANIAQEPLPTRAVGRVEKRPENSEWQYGTHLLVNDLLVCGDCPTPLPLGPDLPAGGGGGVASSGTAVAGPPLGALFLPPESYAPEGPLPWVLYVLTSDTVNLDRYVGQLVEVLGKLSPDSPVDDAPALLVVKEVRSLAAVAAQAGAARPQPGGPFPPSIGQPQ